MMRQIFPLKILGGDARAYQGMQLDLTRAMPQGGVGEVDQLRDLVSVQSKYLI